MVLARTWRVYSFDWVLTVSTPGPPFRATSVIHRSSAFAGRYFGVCRDADVLLLRLPLHGTPAIRRADIDSLRCASCFWVDLS